MLKISEVSRRLQINPQTLYYYERIGLTPPPQRNQAGYRLYSEEDIQRLSLIVRGKLLGLTLDEIRDIITLKEEQSLTCQAVYERLQKKVEEIEEKIRCYCELKDELLPLLQKCEARRNMETDRQCVVLDEFDPSP